MSLVIGKSKSENYIQNVGGTLYYMYGMF